MRARQSKRAGSNIQRSFRGKRKNSVRCRTLLYVFVFLVLLTLGVRFCYDRWTYEELAITPKVVFAGGDVFKVGTPQPVLGEKVDRSGHHDLLPSDEVVNFLREETIRQKKEHDEKVAGLKGPIQHVISNMCLHPEGDAQDSLSGVKVVMQKSCKGKNIGFKNSAEGVIKLTSGNLCLRPFNENNLRETEIILSDRCNDDMARFELTELGDIRHVKSQFCIHVNGGLRKPPENTGLVLFDICGAPRNFFRFYVSVEKEIPGPPPVITNVNDLPKKVAISILITQDPGIGGGFLDSTAALAQSVIEAKSQFLVDLVAIVSPQVQKVRPALRRIGYRILERPLPIELEDIENEKLRKELVNDGCCGPWEFLKLWAWTLDEYDRVLQVDADVHFHRNFDEVFKYNTTLVWTHGALGGTEVMNGGFLVVRPNRDHFNAMVDIVRKGDWREGRGWLGKCCWTYGGRTIQGIVPAYYIYVLEKEHYEVERCRYNNMVEIDRCKTWRFQDVKSNHFTVCQKPWFCRSSRHELCEAFTNSWWNRLNAVKATLGFSEEQGRCDHGYKYLDWRTVNDGGVFYTNQVVETT